MKSSPYAIDRWTTRGWRLPGLVGHPRHGVEPGEAGHSAQPVVHLARVVLLTTLQSSQVSLCRWLSVEWEGYLSERRAQRPPALHLHLLRGGDPRGGVRVDGAPSHSHPAHPSHPSHSAHAAQHTGC